VKSEIWGTFTSYVGKYFEWSGSTSTMKKYYYASGQRSVMRTGSGSGETDLLWLLTDHLNSTSDRANPSGSPNTRMGFSSRIWQPVDLYLLPEYT
jgi:hypothetical protein